MTDIAKHIATHGDLAHLALFLWASGASGLTLLLVRELANATRRFNEFVSAIAQLNHLIRHEDD